ncbi:hypothetical protein IJJ12_02840 [bacterium]|nr:hypothetical protein [bacterium]
MRFAAKTDLAHEWSVQTAAHRREVSRETIAQAQKELATLDELEQLNSQQEARRQQLLTQIRDTHPA